MRKLLTPFKAAMVCLVLLTFGQLSAQPCATPDSVTANPSVLCAGGTANLRAVSAGNNISWYTVPVGGVAIGTVGSGANFAVTPGVTTTYYAEAIGTGGNGSQTFNFTGALQLFTVPSGVTSVVVNASGAQGGLGGGQGAAITGTFAVTPGEVLSVIVGGQGGSYSNGNGGGGGGSFVWKNTGTVLMVAAAGGGGTSNNSNGSLGGPGSGTTTPTNSTNGSGNGTGGTGGNGGQGGPAANNGAGYPAGGGGGAGWSSNGTLGAHQYGATGGSSPANGAAGGTGFNPCGSVNIPGGFGGGGGGGGCSGASGGGGGYNGGGGGNCWNGSTWGSGGGGGSFNGGTTQTNTTGARSGDGIVTITWTGTSCTASQRMPVTVTMDNIAPTAVCQTLTVTLDSTGNGTTTAAAIDNGSSDNCTISSMSLNQTAFTCADAGSTQVTLTVTDNNGNSATCSVSILVQGQNLDADIDADTTACGYNVSCSNGNDGTATATGSGGCAPYTYLWSNGNTNANATGLSAGMNHVTITDASGITYVDSVFLLAPSSIQFVATSNASCANEPTGTIDLTVSGGNDCQGYTFLWSNGATTEDVSNIGAGTHTVTVTDAGGCTNTHTVTVSAMPAPAPTFTQTGNVLTANQTWPSYQWVLNGSNISGANANTYTIAQSGTYSLLVTDSNGCSGVSDTSSIVGIAQQMGEWNDLSLFPNPAQDEFKLRTAAPIGYGISVTIQDMFGRTVVTKDFAELDYEVAFDVKTLANGTYMVSVTSDEGQAKVFRLVVQ